MFPPANRQVATKGLAIVQIRTDNRRLEISAGLHGFNGRRFPESGSRFGPRWPRAAQVARRSSENRKLRESVEENYHPEFRFGGSPRFHLRARDRARPRPPSREN